MGSVDRIRSTTPYSQMAKETHLGTDTVVAPGMGAQLAHFYDRVNSADQRQCREIMRSLNSAKDKARLQRRPKTACAVLGSSHLTKVLDPYSTSYDLDYEKRQGSDVILDRPATAMPFSQPHDLCADLGVSNYDDEFRQRGFNINEPYRTDPQRNNKPHPPQSFMVWRFRPEAPGAKEGSTWLDGITSSDVERALRGKLRSTYQNDYNGCPQGFDIRSAFRVTDDWKSKVPYGYDSTQRQNYDGSRQHPALTNKTDRYGSNRGKQNVSKGAVPLAPRTNFRLNGRTQYVRDYCDKAPGARVPPAIDSSQLQRFMAQPQNHDKDSMEGMYLAMQDNSDLKRMRLSSRVSSIPKPQLPAATPTYCYIPSPPVDTPVC